MQEHIVRLARGKVPVEEGLMQGRDDEIQGDDVWGSDEEMELSSRATSENNDDDEVRGFQHYE